MVIDKEVVFIRNTKQKELILQVLSNDKSHPTIKDIYNKVHALDKNVGQATVYRNINKLVDSGKVKRLSIDKDITRYDGDKSNHYHFICNSCNKVIDIPYKGIDVPADKINHDYNIQIDDCEIIFRGQCNECQSAIKR